ncbi:MULTISPECIES: hypothetical protein [unclassified Niallia]|uniref:hypothetical protein n=1 Tax=unclassified Niallia TaxID=2837522 RepID=UPI0020423991|nr:hypothetical protein [Niallia sp. MER 6]MCM3030370.1 hypothetical protein [Niallia sp. MER 6]
MKLKDHLKTEQLKQLGKMGKKKKRKKQQPKEEKVDWINIMGMDRGRYSRGRGGAIRRK